MKSLPFGYTHRSALIKRYESKIAKVSDKLAEYVADVTDNRDQRVEEFRQLKMQDMRDDIAEYTRLIGTVRDGSHPLIQELEYHNPDGGVPTVQSISRPARSPSVPATIRPYADYFPSKRV